MPEQWESFPLADHPLDQYLGGALAGNGTAFEAAGQKYGVDPRLLAAIATLESGHGTSRATKMYNNPTGMMDPKNPKQFLKYDSISDGIDATASNLSRNYLQQGLTTIPQIGAKYSPPGASNDRNNTNAQWPGTVQKLYTQMGGTGTRFGPQQVGPGVAIMGGYNEPQPVTGRAAYNEPQPSAYIAPPPKPTAYNVPPLKPVAYTLPPIHALADNTSPQNLVDLYRSAASSEPSAWDRFQIVAPGAPIVENPTVSTQPFWYDLLTKAKLVQPTTPIPSSLPLNEPGLEPPPSGPWGGTIPEQSKMAVPEEKLPPERSFQYRTLEPYPPPGTNDRRFIEQQNLQI
jgi:Mannosyl-glycoprotein endo-beta-N-acetylglucosaminidase